jgi:hypothetical protein
LGCRAVVDGDGFVEILVQALGQPGVDGHSVHGFGGRGDFINSIPTLRPSSK